MPTLNPLEGECITVIEIEGLDVYVMLERDAVKVCDQYIPNVFKDIFSFTISVAEVVDLYGFHIDRRKSRISNRFVLTKVNITIKAHVARAQ